MAQSVYSTQFILYGEETPNTVFEVPAGFTAVIRQISYCVQASASLFSVNVADSDAAPANAIDLRTITALDDSTHVEGRWVVPEGGLIELFVDNVGSNPTVYIGGYLLRNVGTR